MYSKAVVYLNGRSVPGNALLGIDTQATSEQAGDLF